MARLNPRTSERSERLGPASGWPWVGLREINDTVRMSEDVGQEGDRPETEGGPEISKLGAVDWGKGVSSFSVRCASSRYRLT